MWQIKSIWALATFSDNLHIDIFATQHRTYFIGKDFGNRLWRHLNVICPILCTCSNLSEDVASAHISVEQTKTFLCVFINDM